MDHTGESAATIHLQSLRDDVLVEVDEEYGSLVVVSTWGEFVLKDPDDRVRESLRRMTLGPVSLGNVSPAHPHDATDGHAADSLDDVLESLSGSVVRSLGLRDGQGPVLSAVPSVAAPEFPLAEIEPTRSLRLSRFATMRTCGGELVLESPLAQFRVVLHQSVATGIATALAQPRTLVDLTASTGVARAVVHDIVAYLVAVGMVRVDAGDGGFDEDSDAAWRQWTAHELMFHRRSRSRQGDGPCDLPAGESDAVPPAVKPPPAAQRFPLPRPAPGDTAASTPLRAVLEIDHSCPDFSGRDLSQDQLGQLLYRSARVRGPGPPHLPHGMTHEATQRPYFSIACLYELEIYVGLGQCGDLPRGIYHYDPADHALTLINRDDSDLGEMLDMATMASGCVRNPAAVLTLTARMDRMRPLAGAAYRTTLMHAGALQQTMTLVAAALGLALHAVPVDAQDIVDRVLGVPWPGEVSVAECVLDRPK